MFLLQDTKPTSVQGGELTNMVSLAGNSCHADHVGRLNSLYTFVGLVSCKGNVVKCFNHLVDTLTDDMTPWSILEPWGIHPCHVLGYAGATR